MLPITQRNSIFVLFNFPKAAFTGLIECVSMVCSLGGGQMTTLLEGGNTSQIMAEDVGSWKLAAQYIQRELKEADEANLLDEEDMHVFGLRPMIDPLILVCCNSCKKPVKASQYATHAEICKSLSSLVDNTTEPDVVAGQKKPPRKERKKLQISTSKVAPVGKPERLTVAKTTASNSHLDERTLKATSFSNQAKGREFSNEAKAGNLKTFDSITSRQTPRKLDDHHLQTNGMSYVPAPLATKIYYSQRTQRLRSAIRQMYYRSSSTQHGDGLSNMQFADSYKIPTQTSTHGYFHHEKIDDQLEKLGKHVACMVESEPVPAKSSDAYSDESRTILPTNFSDQFHVNNALGPQRTMGNLASDFLPNPFDEN